MSSWQFIFLFSGKGLAFQSQTILETTETFIIFLDVGLRVSLRLSVSCFERFKTKPSLIPVTYTRVPSNVRFCHKVSAIHGFRTTRPSRLPLATERETERT